MNSTTLDADTCLYGEALVEVQVKWTLIGDEKVAADRGLWFKRWMDGLVASARISSAAPRLVAYMAMIGLV